MNINHNKNDCKTYKYYELYNSQALSTYNYWRQQKTEAEPSENHDGQVFVDVSDPGKDVVRLFDDTGVETIERDEQGRTLLHLAALQGDLDNIEFLLGLGADINAVDKKGCTPLHAATSSSFNAVKLLVEMGADTTIECCTGDTAAVLARRNGHEGMFRYLQKEISLRNRLFY